MNAQAKLRYLSIVLLLAVQRLPIALGENSASQPERKPTVSEAKGHKRVLLLWQKSDGHPWSAHEYQDGVRIIARCLDSVPGLQTIVIAANDPWTEGPELLDGADGVFLYLAEGARWIDSVSTRHASFERLAQRGGGLVVLHWGMGTRDAAPIDAFVKLFGGCHGGPDRKYRVLKTRGIVRAADHPVMRGIESFEVEDEFYYRLKFAKSQKLRSMTPLLDVKIDDEPQTVAWAWERPDGGRSCGFSGGHFHRNWELPAYRRLVAQSILWTLKLEIPEKGLPVELSEQDLRLTRPKPE